MKKTCTFCKTCICISNFYKNSHSKDGLRSICKKCTDLKKAQYNCVNRDAVSKGSLSWRNNNLDKVLLSIENSSKKNPGRVKEIHIEWIRNNPEKAKARTKRWTSKNPDRVNKYKAERRAALLSASTSWANQFFIEEAYHLAKLREEVLGFKWNVDHIVPLKSRLVCGLHCEANLQVIPSIDNFKKGNRWWPDMW